MRGYAQKQGQHIVPTELGTALVGMYQSLGIPLYKPTLRARMEHDLNLIAEGQKTKEEVLRECIGDMRDVYRKTSSS